MLTGPNGLLTQAEEARTATKDAEIKEKVELEVVGSYDNSGTFQMEILKENLKNNLGITEEIEENEDGSITFSLDGMKVTVDEKGQVEIGEKVPVIEATNIEVEDLTIQPGTKTGKLEVTTTPSEITESLIYTSKNTEVITVENDGTVRVKGEGKATVEVAGKKSGTKGECTVTVEFGVGVKVTSENKKHTNNGQAVIPVGFCIVPGCDDVAEGLVISDNDEDTEADKGSIIANGNQFVWIPVTVSEEEYKANIEYPDTNVSTRLKLDEGYLPNSLKETGKTELEIEKKLVTKEGIDGFYISRYEAGDDSTKISRVEDSGDGKLVSKKGAVVYNYISQEDSKLKSMEFIDNDYIKSSIISGIQWDMTMAFISSKPRLDGNEKEYNVIVNSDSRHIGSSPTFSGKNEADKVCNIYDLEGNCYEYVAEGSLWGGDTYPYMARRRRI